MGADDAGLERPQQDRFGLLVGDLASLHLADAERLVLAVIAELGDETCTMNFDRIRPTIDVGRMQRSQRHA